PCPPVVPPEHRSSFRDPLHLRLEPVPVAAARHHAGIDVHDRDRHQADDHGWRRGYRGEPGHGPRHPRVAAARTGGDPDAEVVRQGPGGLGEIAMAKVEIRDIRKSYGDLEVIHGVTTSVTDGEFIVIVGPSGCGKSTLLRMVAGLEAITSGEISIGDRVVNTLEPKERDIAMGFQNYALYPHMSVFDNMAYGLKIRGLGKAD